MYNLLQPYYATMVRRWHTNPHLGHTVDTVGAHSARMAIMAMQLWPGCEKLVAACLTHDLGEFASGDIPCGAKNKAVADDVADDWSLDHGLMSHIAPGVITRQRLKFLDRLDAYLWARLHAPYVLQEKAWQDQINWLKSEAKNLEVDLCLFNM